MDSPSAGTPGGRGRAAGFGRCMGGDITESAGVSAGGDETGLALGSSEAVGGRTTRGGAFFKGGEVTGEVTGDCPGGEEMGWAGGGELIGEDCAS